MCLYIVCTYLINFFCRFYPTDDLLTQQLTQPNHSSPMVTQHQNLSRKKIVLQILLFKLDIIYMQVVQFWVDKLPIIGFGFSRRYVPAWFGLILFLIPNIFEVWTFRRFFFSDQTICAREQNKQPKPKFQDGYPETIYFSFKASQPCN